MKMIITKIGYRISQSYKIRYDVLIRVGVWAPSHNRNIPKSKVSRVLLGTTSKLGTIGSCVTEIRAQLATDMLLCRPLANPGVVLGLLPIVWPLVYIRLTPVLVSVVVVVGMPMTTRMTPITAKV